MEEKPAQVAMAPKAIGKAGDLPVAKCSRTKGNCQMRSQNTSQRESRRERMSEERRPGAGSFSPEPLGESAFNRLPLGEKGASGDVGYALRAVAACIDLRLQRKEIVVGKAQRFHRDDKVFWEFLGAESSRIWRMNRRG